MLKKIIFLTIFGVFLLGCSKTNSKKKTPLTETPPAAALPDPIIKPTPTKPPSVETEDDLGVGDSPIPYYRFADPPVIVHGVDGNNNLVWSTKTHMPSGFSAKTLTTDNYLAVRIKALTSPARGTADSRGQVCNYQPLPYQKVKVTIRVIGQGAGAESASHTFSANVGQLSDIHSYQVPTGEGFHFEVINPQWDFSCQYEKMNGSWYPGLTQYCDTASVWKNDCIAFELHFATSGTKKFN